MNECLFICDFETTGVDPEIDYPIEIGGIFVNKKTFLVDDVYTSLIKPTDKRFICGNKWSGHALEAYKIHKISVHMLEQYGKDIKTVAKELRSKIAELKENYNYDRFIILSDNAQFEYRFMQKIFTIANEEFPFHYCSWDSSFSLCLASDIGDPEPVHRALPDALRVYTNLVRFLERVNFWGK